MMFQEHKGKSGEALENTVSAVIADMHTHSENSHDSVCKIEEMYCSQREKGTKIFAVTDHFDTMLFDRTDIFSPIKTAYQTVCELNRQDGGEMLILSGLELGEGFWYPEVSQKAVRMLDYDVVIGSVHAVRYRDLTRPYSGIDFSKLDRNTIGEYLDAYFDDMLTMIDTVDFDILAHLTCPLRYITGKYQIEVDLSRCEIKINEILRKIIQKGIALEVNTSSLDTLGDFMPPRSILKRYRDMGGYLITLGSDAHIAEHASKHFREAIGELKKLGFENIFAYRKRTPFAMQI